MIFYQVANIILTFLIIIGIIVILNQECRIRSLMEDIQDKVTLQYYIKDIDQCCCSIRRTKHYLELKEYKVAIVLYEDVLDFLRILIGKLENCKAKGSSESYIQQLGVITVRMKVDIEGLYRECELTRGNFNATLSILNLNDASGILSKIQADQKLLL